MKQLIKDILEDVSKGQPNLESEAAREMIANLIMTGIRSGKGWFLDLGTRDKDSTNESLVEAKDSWVCGICNKSTYDVEYDYLGSGTNHLSCELEIEMKNDNLDTAGIPIEKIDEWLVRDIDKEVMINSTNLKPKIKPQEKQYTVVADLGYDCRDKKQTIIGRISESEYEWLIGEK